MTTSLNNGILTFGDGTTQSTKTPTVVSAFTNDVGYTTDAVIATSYATKAQAGYNWYYGNSGAALAINTYNINGSLIASQSFNCNCNC